MGSAPKVLLSRLVNCPVPSSRRVSLRRGRLLVTPRLRGEDAEWVVPRGHAGLVAEPLTDVEGALVLPGRLLVIPPLIGEIPELVITVGHARLVAEPLFDVEGTLALA